MASNSPVDPQDASSSSSRLPRTPTESVTTPKGLRSRPELERVDTAQILDYYGSSDADSGQPYNTTPIGTSSGYTAVQSISQPFHTSTPSPPPQHETSPPGIRRSRLPSAGAADNRRLHIVELDASSNEAGVGQQTHPQSLESLSEQQEPSRLASATSGLLARRGLDHGPLALVAPPDADAASYTNLSPPEIPKSAPPRRQKYGLGDSDDGDESELAPRDHRRTRSNIIGDQGSRERQGLGASSSHSRKFGGKHSPRDGMLFFPPGDYTVAVPSAWKRSSGTTDDPSRRGHDGAKDTASGSSPTSTTSPPNLVSTAISRASPTFYALPSTSPTSTSLRTSPTKRPHLLPSLSSSSSEKIITPGIGEEKDPMIRVAGPVVVGLGYNLPGSSSMNGHISPTTIPSPLGTSSRPGSGSGSVAAAPPPRPPRAVGARRGPIAAKVQQSIPIPQTVPSAFSRPHLATLNSDYSLSAVTVSSTGSSNSIPLAASRSNGSAVSEDAEGELPAIPRHRREGAHATTIDDCSVSTDAPSVAVVVNDVTPEEKPAPTTSPTIPTSTSQDLQPSLSRPQLTSKWSSWSSLPTEPTSASVASKLPPVESMEDLMMAVDHDIDDIGLMKSSDAPPPTVVEPPRDAERDLTNRRVVNARTGSRSPGLEKVEEGEVSEPTSSSLPTELLQPSNTPSRPSSTSSDGGLSTKVDLTSPMKALPQPAKHIMTGVGAGMGRTGRRESPFENVVEESASEWEQDSKRSIGGDIPRRPSFQGPNRSSSFRSKRLSGGTSPVPKSPSFVSSTFSFRKQTAPSNFATTPVRKTYRRPGQLPDAMSCKDVLQRKSPLERATGYAQKLRELCVEEESGLGDWILHCKSSSAGSGGAAAAVSRRAARDPSPGVSALGLGRSPSKASDKFSPQLRNVSHGSEASEATFPVRADAYTATMLSTRDSPPRGPPAGLPYPGLAHNVGVRSMRNFGTTVMTNTAGLPNAPAYSNSMRSLTSPKTTGTGFFATIGRKASMRGASRPTLAQLNPKSPTVENQNGGGAGFSGLASRPSQVSLPKRREPGPKGLMMNNHTVIGGPRPPPSKVSVGRSNSLLATIGRRSTEKEKDEHTAFMDKAISEAGGDHHYTTRERSESPPEADAASIQSTPSANSDQVVLGANLLPRSSLTYKRISVGRASTDPSIIFNANLEKLTDVLPHVERSTLALYLRRAGGEDIRAIGAYLEDEKNGTVMGR